MARATSSRVVVTASPWAAKSPSTGSQHSPPAVASTVDRNITSCVLPSAAVAFPTSVSSALTKTFVARYDAMATGDKHIEVTVPHGELARQVRGVSQLFALFGCACGVFCVDGRRSMVDRCTVT